MRSEAKRSDLPYGHASMLLLGEGSEATEPYNKYVKIRPHSIRSLQFDQKIRLLSFRPEKFNLFTATLFLPETIRQIFFAETSAAMFLPKRLSPKRPESHLSPCGTYFCHCDVYSPVNIYFSVQNFSEEKQNMQIMI